MQLKDGNSQGISAEEKEMAMEPINFQMETSMSANGLIIKCMAKESILGR